MSKPEELYEGLPKEFGTTHRQEAMDKYGKKTIEKTENELLKMGKPNFKKLQADFEQVNAVLFSCRYDQPDSESVQQLVAHHYDIIRKFGGTYQSNDKQAKAYAGLGQLYVQNERYTMVDGKAQPDYARFLQRAMRHFADTAL